MKRILMVFSLGLFATSVMANQIAQARQNLLHRVMQRCQSNKIDFYTEYLIDYAYTSTEDGSYYYFAQNPNSIDPPKEMNNVVGVIAFLDSETGECDLRERKPTLSVPASFSSLIPKNVAEHFSTQTWIKDIEHFGGVEHFRDYLREDPNQNHDTGLFFTEEDVRTLMRLGFEMPTYYTLVPNSPDAAKIISIFHGFSTTHSTVVSIHNVEIVEPYAIATVNRVGEQGKMIAYRNGEIWEVIADYIGFLDPEQLQEYYAIPTEYGSQLLDSNDSNWRSLVQQGD